MNAEVVGINTLAAGKAGSTMAQGVGFSISMNAARPIANQLAAGQPVSHPYLGIAYVALNPGLAWRLSTTVQQGLLVTNVASGSPAAGAGLQQRDVILEVDDQPIRDETTLGRIFNRNGPGDHVQLIVDRNGTRLTLTVTIGKRSQ